MPAHNYLFSSSSDNDNDDDDDAVQALGRPAMACDNHVDPEVSVIAKIPNNCDNDEDCFHYA